jgi:hypothetical protein
MRNVLLASLLAILTCSIANATSPRNRIHPGGLQLVAQLPKELPQRVKGFAYDGKKLWATVYLGRGRYAILDPSTLLWEISSDEQQHRPIAKVSGSFESPGAICFANGALWVAGAYGDSFGLIDTQNWTIQRMFKGKQREDVASQSYASMTFDGNHLWIAWHWFRYNMLRSQTQLLLKVDPETGKVVAEYPAPSGTRNDGTHGLTWDGTQLWHAKDNRLSSIDPSTGQVTAQYVFDELKRPSGLAWDGQALWIAEFDGKIWRLSF